MTMSQLADRLESRGASTANRSRRRPARALHLTPDGLHLRRRLQPAALAAQHRILAPLGRGAADLVDLMTR